ncbi:hypothetical protein G6F53_008456 [Rhizopus delemar]|nr:hypothetical protein G6F53_008456 [Rhizopus delemar]
MHSSVERIDNPHVAVDIAVVGKETNSMFQCKQQAAMNDIRNGASVGYDIRQYPLDNLTMLNIYYNLKGGLDFEQERHVLLLQNVWIVLLEDVKTIHAFRSCSSQMLWATADLTTRDLITTLGVGGDRTVLRRRLKGLNAMAVNDLIKKLLKDIMQAYGTFKVQAQALAQDAVTVQSLMSQSQASLFRAQLQASIV